MASQGTSRRANHWEVNLQVLKEKYPGLAEALAGKASDEEASDIQVEDAVSGLPTLRIQGLYIHSPRDPAREGRRAAEAAEKAGGTDAASALGPVIFLGFGLGYAVEAVAEQWPGRPLIILERRKAVLQAALQARDLRRALRAEPLIIVLGEDENGTAVNPDSVLAALRVLEKLPGGSNPEGTALIHNRGLMALDEAWYAEAERHIRSWISKNEVNQATLRRFGKRWVRNLARNMETIRDIPGISLLDGVLEERPAAAAVPAFLAAAGPSLEETGPLLREIARRCLVVAVDTSLRFLLEQGVNPDFAVAVDPQYWNARHLDRAPAPRTCLIAESAVYPSVLGHPFGRILLCGSLFPLGRFIEDRVDPKGVLGAGGSVATTAWDFARRLGASSLWIAGLDLSFPGLKTHFKGALFEERALGEATRLVPAETRSVRALRDGYPFKAPAAGGGRVLTDRRLSLYAAWFENRFRLFPALRSYSLSAKGLAIPGLTPASTEELLRLPVRREEINRRLAEAFAGVTGKLTQPEEIARRASRYESARGALLEGLERIRGLAKEAADLAEETLRTPGGDRQRILSKLDAANRFILESEVKDVAGFLFPPARELEKSLRVPESNPYGRHLELSGRLYRALEQAAAYHVLILRQPHKARVHASAPPIF